MAVTANRLGKSSSRKSATERLNLVLPNPLLVELRSFADRHQTTVVDIVRQILKVGLFVLKTLEDPNAALIVRRGETEERVRLL